MKLTISLLQILEYRNLQKRIKNVSNVPLKKLKKKYKVS
jgi:hypothetical protein